MLYLDIFKAERLSVLSLGDTGPAYLVVMQQCVTRASSRQPRHVSRKPCPHTRTATHASLLLEAFNHLYV
jgi:hypothetical protein